MNVETLRAQALEILDSLNNTQKEGFELKSFTLGTGGLPHVSVDGLENEIVESGIEYCYDTDRNGPAMSGFIAIPCKEVGTDRDGEIIYLTLNGLTFVEKYEPGTPEYFDESWLQSPNI